MPHAYTEDQLVEQPAIGLFAELELVVDMALKKSSGQSGFVSSFSGPFILR